MDDHLVEIALRLGGAWIAGGLIGLDRSYHEKPAGFRTHALVCVASALLMLVTAYPWSWLSDAVPAESVRIDPQRIAQGIMTGIGFLGAGAIFRDRLIVRGVTTAASIWVTAALGILYGAGYYSPAVIGTTIVLATLVPLRLVEARLPLTVGAFHSLSVANDGAMSEDDLRELLARHDIEASDIGYRLTDERSILEYRMSLRTRDRANLDRLAATLRTHPEVLEFRLSPSGDSNGD